MAARLLAVALVALTTASAAKPPVLGPFARYTKVSAPKSGDPTGCCLPSNVFELFLVSTESSQTPNAGYGTTFQQVDGKNQLYYAFSEWVPLSGVVQNTSIWIIKSPAPSTWFQYYQTNGTCWVQTITSMPSPSPFDAPCWKAPEFSYSGSMSAGMTKCDVYASATGTETGQTLFIEPTQCVPHFGLTWSVTPQGQWAWTQWNVINPQFQIVDPSKFTPPTGCSHLPPSKMAEVMAKSALPSQFRL